MDQNSQDRLDLTISDDSIVLAKNFGDCKSIIIDIDNEQNRLFVELMDIILNPGKHNLYVHDTRQRNVYSSVAFAIESDEIKK